MAANSSVATVVPRDDMLLTVPELAHLLGVDRKTVYEAISRGEIPGARRIGRTIRICRDSVLAWLRDSDRVSRSSRR